MDLADNSEYTEFVACKMSDLKSGEKEEMKEVNLGENGKCLLVRHVDGEITAVGHKCTHYGAPLVKGVLANGRVRCPWHGACFNSKTGDIEDFPGLDSLPKFKVTIRDDDVIVSARQQQLNNSKRNDLLSKTCQGSIVPTPATDNSHCVVIIGGGPSSVTCAETLRKQGFMDRIVILSKEKHPPYDRPKLSKALDVEPAKAYLRQDGSKYFKRIGVELYTDTEVKSVNVLTKSVRLSKHLSSATSNGGLDLKYDTLVIATGGQPRTLEPTPGWNLKNVFILRTIDDANAIAKASEGQNVVVVGSSFIGMEVASFLASKKLPGSLSIICGKGSSVPFEHSLGKEIGGVVKKLHEEKGSVKFYCSVGVKSLSSENGHGAITHVTLSDETKINADVVIVGIGVTPATEFLRDSEIRMTDRGFVIVDGRMQSKVPHVYAIGDIAMFPLQCKGGSLTNIQHWQMAHKHGSIAAKDIAHSTRRASKGLYSGIEISASERHVDSVPFFWTVQYGMSIRYAGYGSGFNDIVIVGDLEEQKFVAYYLSGDTVVAVATMKADPQAAAFAERINAGEVITRANIPRTL